MPHWTLSVNGDTSRRCSTACLHDAGRRLKFTSGSIFGLRSAESSHAQEIAGQGGFDFEKPEVAIFARIGKIDRHTLEDRRGFGAHDEDLLREEDSLADAVRDEENCLAGFFPDPD